MLFDVQLKKSKSCEEQSFWKATSNPAVKLDPLHLRFALVSREHLYLVLLAFQLHSFSKTKTEMMHFMSLLTILLFGSSVNALSVQRLSTTASSTTSRLSTPSPSSVEVTKNSEKKATRDWELDCYSRPVVGLGGKKLWEVLITDSTGSFRFLKTLPSNQVNSKELRKTVDGLIEEADVKPDTIRFFRGAMFNMINIALAELDVVGKPSRCTYSVAQWLEERHQEVYPKMEG